MFERIGDYLLRDWENKDAQAIAAYANNRKIWLNLRDGFPSPYTPRDAEQFIAKVNQADPRTVFAIATETEAIGSIGLVLGSDVHRYTAEIGYFLAEPFWGKGIMTQAVHYFTTWAIQKFRLHRISAEPYAPNRASRRVLEKAGYVYEGTCRSSVFKNGEIMDQAVYSCIRGRTG
jgi:RimJ/RimL family protein N-acetyltransferase